MRLKTEEVESIIYKSLEGQRKYDHVPKKRNGSSSETTLNNK